MLSGRMYRQAMLAQALIVIQQQQEKANLAARKEAEALAAREEVEIVRNWVEDLKRKNGSIKHVCTRCTNPFLGNRKRQKCFDCSTVRKS